MNEENEKVQNQDEEILNPQESETVEGGVRSITEPTNVDLADNDKGEGCNCKCHG